MHHSMYYQSAEQYEINLLKLMEFVLFPSEIYKNLRSY